MFGANLSDRVVAAPKEDETAESAAPPAPTKEEEKPSADKPALVEAKVSQATRQHLL